MEEGEEVGDGTAEGSSAIGDGGRTLISFIPDVDGIRFCFLAGFNSIYPLEKNDPGLVWVVTLFLIIKDSVALACILNSCCNLCVLFYVLVLCLRN